MIQLLAFAALAPARVLTFVDPKATRVSIQALLPLPSLGAKDMAKLAIIGQAIPKQTLDYPRREMLMVTGGEPARCNISPDYLRLVVNVPPENLRAGLSVMLSLLRNATLTQENLDAAAQELPQADYWTAALDPMIFPTVQLNTDEAKKLCERVFRPERVTLIVGGKFDPTTAEQEWLSRISQWTVDKEPRGYFDISAPTARTQNLGGVTTIDFVAAPVGANDTAMPSRILSLFALGVGKGASLFRVVREKHAWSYRQEAILEPSRDGWLPQLLIATIPSDDVKDRIKVMRADLMDDVASWTGATRLRALGMAQAVFDNDVAFNPLYILGDAPVGNSLEDQTYLHGYWQLKTGKPWDSKALLNDMEQVSLEELKARAGEILTTAIPRVLPGS